MAVTFDTVTEQTGNISSFSINHTLTGANRWACIIAGSAQTGSLSSVTGPGGTWSETLIVTESGETIALWEPTSEPASGSQTFAGSLSGMAHSVVAVVSFAGVDVGGTPSDDPQTDQTASGTSLLDIHTTTAGDMIIGGVHSETAISFTQTQRSQSSQAGHRVGTGTGTGVVLGVTFSTSAAMMASIVLNAVPGATTIVQDPIMGPGIIPFLR